LELAGNISVPEPLTVSCKASASGNVPAVVNVSGTNTLAGEIVLTTGGSFWTFEAAGGRLHITGATTNSTTTNVRTIWLRGAAEGEWASAIGDSATNLATAIRKDESGLWTLSGDNAATGTITVSNGTLLVNGTVRGPVNVVGGTLGGDGLITAPVAVNGNSSLAPGNSVGVLTISNTLTLAAGSTTRMELNALASTCDRVVALSNVVFAGTLALTNVAGALSGGQSYQLFAASSWSGNFAALSPATPGPNLTWNFNPTNGTLFIVALPPPQITSASYGPGNVFTLSGTGTSGAAYRVLTTTNLALPMGSWTVSSTGVFSGGVMSFTDTLVTNFNRRFYRLVTP
jgi:autotransporter-associated beta strand protein